MEVCDYSEMCLKKKTVILMYKDIGRTFSLYYQSSSTYLFIIICTSITEI